MILSYGSNIVVIDGTLIEKSPKQKKMMENTLGLSSFGRE